MHGEATIWKFLQFSFRMPPKHWTSVTTVSVSNPCDFVKEFVITQGQGACRMRERWQWMVSFLLSRMRYSTPDLPIPPGVLTCLLKGDVSRDEMHILCFSFRDFDFVYCNKTRDYGLRQTKTGWLLWTTSLYYFIDNYRPIRTQPNSTTIYCNIMSCVQTRYKFRPKRSIKRLYLKIF
jgi:hypothetical protein